MGLYKYLKQAWKNPSNEAYATYKNRLIDWRREETSVRIERPTRLDRARSLGYRAKQGIIIVRVRVERGGRKRARPTKKGRRSKRQTTRKIVRKSYQWIAEERGNKKYKNCEVLNSYYVGEDGIYKWFEVILIDRDHPQIMNDKGLMNLANQRGRVYRGLTSAGRKSRGLSGKGKGFEKMRPSRRAHNRVGG